MLRPAWYNPFNLFFWQIVLENPNWSSQSWEANNKHHGELFKLNKLHNNIEYHMGFLMWYSAKNIEIFPEADNNTWKAKAHVYILLLLADVTIGNTSTSGTSDYSLEEMAMIFPVMKLFHVFGLCIIWYIKIPCKVNPQVFVFLYTGSEEVCCEYAAHGFQLCLLWCTYIKWNSYALFQEHASSNLMSNLVRNFVSGFTWYVFRLQCKLFIGNNDVNKIDNVHLSLSYVTTSPHILKW